MSLLKHFDEYVGEINDVVKHHKNNPRTLECGIKKAVNALHDGLFIGS